MKIDPKHLETYEKYGKPFTGVELHDVVRDPHPWMSMFDIFRYIKPGDKMGAFVNTLDPTGQNVYFNLATKINPEVLLFHEIDHLWNQRSGINRYNVFGKEKADKFIEDVFNNADYIVKKYPELRNIAYLYRDVVERERKQGTYLPQDRLLDEIVSSLAAYEMKTGKYLTEDPVLKKNVFYDPYVTEAYEATSKWRATRWDPKDLEPNIPRYLIDYRKDLLK